MLDKKDSPLDMFVNKPLNIKLFFIFSFILFGLVITIVSFYLNHRYQDQLLEKKLKSEVYTEFNTKITVLEEYLKKYKNELISLRNNKILINYIQTKNETTNKNLKELFSFIIDSDKNILELRYLDKDGIEKIRLQRDANKNSFSIVDDRLLQDKSKRYYFKQASKVSDESLWISDIDLNVENEKVQEPHVPIIRFATPVYENNNFEGIIITNIYMEKILEKIKKSKLFKVSLIDSDGEILLGEFIYNGQLKNLSWSRYLLKDVKLKNYLPKYEKSILENDEFSKDGIESKYISDELGLRQKLFLLLEIRKDNLDELKKGITDSILNIVTIIFLISIFLGVILSFIPSRLAKKLYKSKKVLDETKLLLDEYLEALNVNNIVTKGDLRGNITYINENFTKVTGYTQEEVIGRPHSLLRADTEKKVFEEMWATIQGKKTWRGILKNKKKNGDYYYVDIVIVPILNTSGDIIEYFGIRHNITELMQQRQSLIELATKDSLTGYGNRSKLMEDINKNRINNVAVIDIDNFSSINDFYSHVIGDTVIKKFADLINESLSNKFSLYRLHADKFAILNTNLDEELFVDFMKALNKKIHNSVIDLEVKTFDIITTVGISFEHNFEVLLTAEVANKHAKKSKKHLLVYSKKLHIEKEFEENLIWVTKIKNALNEKKVVVQYQAIFNNHTQKIEKYEVLVRIEGDDGRLISPAFFLNISKKSKQYILITQRVIELSFEKFKDIDMEFSINLTIEDILNKELGEFLISKIKEYGVGKKLVIELVESEYIESFEEIERFVKEVKSFGVRIAIDDFGTGYSNFEYLIRIEADYIKLDGSLIKEINENYNTKEIVKTMVDFARKMNFKTIAEFVSSEDIYNTVKDLGIDYSQGYFIGIPKDELDE